MLPLDFDSPYQNVGILLVFLSSNKTLPLVIAHGNPHYEAFGRKNLY
jgi:hypothetical protein